ncbi:MAG: site-specific integrase [Oscillospiraceae bacterium]|nr:site-specific integrase [Oscillospiraceae bacterium]
MNSRVRCDYKEIFDTVLCVQIGDKCHEDGKLVIKFKNQLKIESSFRTLPLIPYIAELLQRKKMQNQYFSTTLRRGYNHDYDDFICTDNFGNLITPNFVTDHFRNMIKKHKLKKLRFHDLRHSCASLLLANGVPMKAIQEWLGHSTFNVTANFYSHLDYQSKLSSAEAIANALSFHEDNHEPEKKVRSRKKKDRPL